MSQCFTGSLKIRINHCKLRSKFNHEYIKNQRDDHENKILMFIIILIAPLNSIC